MKKQTILLFLLAFAMSSCTHYYYIPNVQNVPLFREKHDTRIMIAAGGTDAIPTTELQTAYSITDKWAVMASFMSAKGRRDTSNNAGTGKYFEAAFGYYRPLEQHGVFEIYGGVGVSNQHHQYENDKKNNGSADLSFVKLFIHPTLGLTFKEFDIALSARVCQLTFNKIDNKINLQSNEYYYLDTISQHPTSYLFEPALTVRGGWKYLKLQAQLGLSQNLSNPNLRFIKSSLSVGLYFSFANWFTTIA